jgi:4-hydroxy-4-methyl-2-oxoglutarate aldolase
MDMMADLAARLEKCHTGAVFDVLRERGITNTVLPKDIRPLDPGHVLAGPVFTVRGSPKSNIDAHETLLAWTGFLSEAAAGHVVISIGHDDNRALMGELSAETLQYRGVKGYVTDGGCRDSAFILKIGFPVFARYYTPRDVVGAWTVDALQQPIRIGDVDVAPGDYIIADIDGAVIIPGAIAAEVVAEVEIIMETENKVRTAILQGVSPREAYLQHGKF